MPAADSDFEIGLPEQATAFLLARLEHTNLLIEYGSGGSTLAAAGQPGCTVVTVESDRVWLDRLLRAARARGVADRIVGLWCDIGPTKAWGAPEDFSQWRKFVHYAQAPWAHVRRHHLRPDLIFIDGRFRVASFLASLASIKQPTEILLDDYPDRPNYRVIDRILAPAAIIDNRLAVFEAEPGQLSVEELMWHVDVFYRPYH